MKNHLKKGVASALVKYAKAAFKQLGVSRVYLYTDNINLYEKYGRKYLETMENSNGEIRRIFYLDI